MEFFRKKNSSADEVEILRERLKDCTRRRELLLDAVRALVPAIKDLSIEAEDLDTASIKDRLDGLSAKLGSDEDLRSVESRFQEDREQLLVHAERQRRYLKDRERELNEIIGTLTAAITSISRENRTFTDRIHAQSERIQDLTRLEDLKELKQALAGEVEQVRRTLFEKQLADEHRMERLSRRVKGLDAELKHVKMGVFRDGLTGAYNLKALERRMEETVTRSSVKGESFSFLVLDIDNYSRIIETSGRNLADRVVLAIAQNCQAFISGDEFIARCREGIFSIIIPGQTLRSSAKRAARLCKAIASARYAVDESQPGHIVSFTVSIGLSSYTGKDDSRSVVERALKALYAAKRSGGNRVVTEKALFLRFRQGGDTIEPLY